MNNKGQTLVIFVLILPILILGISFVFIKLYTKYEQRKQEELIEILCRSRENKSNLELIKLGNINDKTQDINIEKVKDSIKITLTKETYLKIKIKTSTIC